MSACCQYHIYVDVLVMLVSCDICVLVALSLVMSMYVQLLSWR